jgi:uncharacterized protein YoxC
MGLAAEMKNLSEELLASFKQRILENEELVTDVQKTLEGFNKDHREMAAILNANATALRKGLKEGEMERLDTYRELMNGIHLTMDTIQKEVAAIQTSTLNMISDFGAERAQMADELDKSFVEGRAERKNNEKTRIKAFNAMMKVINEDIRNINNDVLGIFKFTNDLLDRFDSEHLEMSAELRAQLGKNLAERVEYTRKMLRGFQKRLAEIGKENQKMAHKLSKDLAAGEASRLGEYQAIMKGIHQSIKGIRKEVSDIQKSTNSMIGSLTGERVMGQAEWSKMLDAMAQIRKTGIAKPAKALAKAQPRKDEKKESKAEAIIQPMETSPSPEPKQQVFQTLEERVLDYINRHPNGVKVSEMEEPLGETRMKLGFTAKGLLEEGKVQKLDNFYFPLK